MTEHLIMGFSTALCRGFRLEKSLWLIHDSRMI